MPAAAQPKRPVIKSAAPAKPQTNEAGTNVVEFDRSDANGLFNDPLAIEDVETISRRKAELEPGNDEDLKDHGVFFHESIAGAPWSKGIKDRSEEIDQQTDGMSSLTKTLFAIWLIAILVVAFIRFGGL